MPRTIRYVEILSDTRTEKEKKREMADNDDERYTPKENIYLPKKLKKKIDIFKYLLCVQKDWRSTETPGKREKRKGKKYLGIPVTRQHKKRGREAT